MSAELSELVERVFEELHQKIFYFLDIKQLCNVGLVCKRWEQFSSNASAWQEEYHASFGSFQTKVDGITWKKMYSLMNSRYQSSWESFHIGAFVLCKLMLNGETSYQMRIKTDEENVKILTNVPSRASESTEVTMKLNTTKNIGKWKNKLEKVLYKGINDLCAVIESKDSDCTVLSWISLRDHSCVKIMTTSRVSMKEHYVTSQAVGDASVLINRGSSAERVLKCSVVSTVTSEANSMYVLQEMLSYSSKEIPGGSVHYEAKGISSSSLDLLYGSSKNRDILLHDCLYYAIHSGDSTLVRSIWDFGFTVTKEEDILEFKPLFYSCKVSHLHKNPLEIPILLMKLNYLQGRESGVKHINKKGKSTIHYAAKHSNFPLLSYLIENDVSMSQVDHKNRSAISIILKNIDTLSDIQTRLDDYLGIIQLLMKDPSCIEQLNDDFMVSAITKLAFTDIKESQNDSLVQWIISLCKNGVSLDCDKSSHPLSKIPNPYFDIKIVKTLLYCGVNPDLWFPFFPAEVANHPEIEFFKSHPTFSDLLKRSISAIDLIAVSALTARRNYSIKDLTFSPIIEVIHGSKNLEIAKVIHSMFGIEVIQFKSEQSGKFPLHYATIDSSLEFVKWLIECSADLNCIDGDQNTPLVYSILNMMEMHSKERKEIMNLLLQRGANPNVAVNNSESLLHTFLRNSSPSTEMILRSMLYYSNLEVNITDQQGLTPLELLCKLPKVDSKIMWGFIALCDEIYKKEKYDNAKKILMLNDSYSHDEKEALLKALQFSDIEFKIQSIQTNSYLGLKLSKNIESFEYQGENIMTYTAQYCRETQILELLDSLKVSIEMTNKNGFTAFLVACINNNFEFAGFLLDRNANSHVVDANNFSPLYYCFQYLFSPQYDSSKADLLYRIIKTLVTKGLLHEIRHWPVSPIHGLMISLLVTQDNDNEDRGDNNEQFILEGNYRMFSKYLDLLIDDAKLDINYLNQQNETPLLLLCKNQDLSSLKPLRMLQDKGASFHEIPIRSFILSFPQFPEFIKEYVISVHGVSLLINSILIHDIEFVNYIIENYVQRIDFNSHDTKTELTPLIAAIMADQIDIIDVLLKNSVDVNQTANKFQQKYGLKGLHPLQVACIYSNLKVVKLLLQYHSAIDETNSEFNEQFGNYPINLVAENLMIASPNPHYQNSQQFVSGSVEILKLLIMNQGVQLNVTDTKKKGPMHYLVHSIFTRNSYGNDDVQDSVENLKIEQNGHSFLEAMYQNDPLDNAHQQKNDISISSLAKAITFNELVGLMVARGSDLNHSFLKSAYIIDPNEIFFTPLLELFTSEHLISYRPIQVLFDHGAKLLAIANRPFEFFENIIEKNVSLTGRQQEKQQIINTLQFYFTVETLLNEDNDTEIKKKLGSTLIEQLKSNNLIRPHGSLPLPLYLFQSPDIRFIKLNYLSGLTKPLPLIKDLNGRSGLFYAIQARNKSTLHYCVEKQLVGVPDNKNQIPLHYACELYLETNDEGLLSTIEYLLDSKSNPNHQDHQGNTPLMILISKAKSFNDLKAITLFFRYNINYALKNHDNNSLLHLLLYNIKFLNLVKLDPLDPIFMEYSLQNFKNTEGMTPNMMFNELEYDGSVDELRLQLLACGFTVSSLKLFEACRIGDLELVTQLISKGYSPNSMNEDYVTPFVEALTNHHFEITRFLTIHSYDSIVQYQDAEKNSTLHILAKHSSDLNHYLENGAKVLVNRTNSQKNTPLHEICFQLHKPEAVAELISLLKFGAKIDIKNVQGDSPLHLAVRRNNLEAVKVMIHFGSPKFYMPALYLKNTYHKTPTDISIASKFSEMSKFLILHGGYETRDNQFSLHQSSIKPLYHGISFFYNH